MEKTIEYSVDFYRSDLQLWSDEEIEIECTKKDGMVFSTLDDLKKYYATQFLDGRYGCKQVRNTTLFVSQRKSIVVDEETYINTQHIQLETDEMGAYVECL